QSVVLEQPGSADAGAGVGSYAGRAGLGRAARQPADLHVPEHHRDESARADGAPGCEHRGRARSHGGRPSRGDSGMSEQFVFHGLPESVRTGDRRGNLMKQAFLIAAALLAGCGDDTQPTVDLTGMEMHPNTVIVAMGKSVRLI